MTHDIELPGDPAVHPTAGQEAVTAPMLSVMTGEGEGSDRGPLFAMSFRGYDRDQVEQHLDDLAAELHHLEGQRAALEQDLAAAREQLAVATAAESEAGYPTYRSMGERVAQIFALAEEEVATLRAAAERERDSLLSKARAAAAEIDAERERRLAAIEAEMATRREAMEREFSAAEAAAQQRLAALQQQHDDVAARLRDIAARINPGELPG